MDYSDFYKTANESSVQNFAIQDNNSILTMGDHAAMPNYNFKIECLYGASLHTFNSDNNRNLNDNNGLYVIRPGSKINVDYTLKSSEDNIDAENAIAVCVDTSKIEKTDNVHVPFVIKGCVVSNQAGNFYLSTLDNKPINNVLLVVSLYQGQQRNFDHYYIESERTASTLNGVDEEIDPFYSPFPDLENHQTGANFQDLRDYLILTREDFDFEETTNTFNKQLLTNSNYKEVLQLKDDTNVNLEDATTRVKLSQDFDNQKWDYIQTHNFDTSKLTDTYDNNGVASEGTDGFGFSSQIRMDQNIGFDSSSDAKIGLLATIYWNRGSDIYAQNNLCFFLINKANTFISSPVDIPGFNANWGTVFDKDGNPTYKQSGTIDMAYQPIINNDFSMDLVSLPASGTTKWNTVILDNKLNQEKIVSHETTEITGIFTARGEFSNWRALSTTNEGGNHVRELDPSNGKMELSATTYYGF